MLSSSQRLPDQARWEEEAISIIPVCEGYIPAMLASNSSTPSSRATHRRAPRMLPTTACRITILFIWFSSYCCWPLNAPAEYGLGVQLAPLHPRQQGHPGEDLRQRAWQAEAVGEIVIAAWSAF